jgi:hypothetical protein
MADISQRGCQEKLLKAYLQVLKVQNFHYFIARVKRILLCHWSEFLGHGPQCYRHFVRHGSAASLGTDL